MTRRLTWMLSVVLGLAALAVPAPAPAALPPRYDFSLELLLQGSILTLDPLRARSRAELDAAGLLFEGLVEMTERGARPAAAERWSVSADSLEWRFQIDPNRRFGDGTPLRSAAVLAAWSRTRLEAPEWGWLFEGWTASAEDSLTLRLVLDRRLAGFPGQLALPGAWVAREVDRGGAKSLSGTAAFRFAGRQAEGFLLAPRLDDPRGRPFAGRLLLRTPRPGAEAQRSWREASLAIADLGLLPRRPEGSVLLERGSSSTWLLLLNPRRPALPPAVRAALAGALDRRRLAGVGPDAGLRERHGWRAGSAGKSPSPLPPERRVSGLRVACDAGDPVAVALGEELAAQLGVAPAPMDAAGARQAVRQGNFDLALVRWDPQAGGEFGRIELTHRPEFAGLTPSGMEAPRSAMDRLLFWQAESVLLPLVERPERLVRSGALTGLALDELTRLLRLADAWPAESAADPGAP